MQVGQKCNIEDMRRAKNTPPGRGAHRRWGEGDSIYSKNQKTVEQEDDIKAMI